MLKIMTFVLSNIFVYILFASDIQVSANMPVECETYSGNIEMVMAPSIKTIDNSTIVTFFGAFGTCRNKTKITNNLRKFIKINFWNEGVNTPWNQFQGDVVITKISEKVFKVKIFFDSDILFDHNRQDRHFTFTMLHSNNRYAREGATRKSWNLFVTQNSVEIY